MKLSPQEALGKRYTPDFSIENPTYFTIIGVIKDFHIASLKEDIDAARSNDFGRKIFEAFANEYTTSHLNENSEVSKLMDVLNVKDKQLVEAKAFATKAKTLAESANGVVSVQLLSDTSKSFFYDVEDTIALGGVVGVGTDGKGKADDTSVDVCLAKNAVVAGAIGTGYNL
jgi:hypothetical protein